MDEPINKITKKKKPTPIVDMVYRLSAGRIKNETQAKLVLILVIIISVFISIFFLQKTFSPTPTELVLPVNSKII